jgi:hypothetical protein
MRAHPALLGRLPGGGFANADKRQRSPWTRPTGRPFARSAAGLTARRGAPTLTAGARMADLPELPTGTVTFLFTDLEGNTRLL